MVKRFFDLTANEMVELNKEDLLTAIQACEGRVVLSENDVTRGPTVIGVTNSELARASGADLILLNKLDLQDPKIPALANSSKPIADLKKLVMRPIGVNLEAVSHHHEKSLEPLLTLPTGRIASYDNCNLAERMGFDFICLTGNPKTGVSLSALVEALRVARDAFSGIIMIGKMHSAGVDEPVIDCETVSAFIDAGADVILIPTPGSLPGFTREEAIELTRLCHQKGKLTLAVNGASQDYSSRETIRQFAIINKEIGADIHHIGSSGTGGIAPSENIFELSLAIRGLNHTLRQMASSIKR
ncbi:hypothetical protein [Facklamia hominis]|uniref:DUF7916 family protein n=1 Tax=Facklamia hominis TaxID=178214 RepID=UPI0003534825|nr:hypothetical protein [Facklamia hominis]EPH13282.1 hypothetical protein HMPREF9260_00054 [Facklamia hominis ACS-120-V-Sch10]